MQPHHSGPLSIVTEQGIQRHRLSNPFPNHAPTLMGTTAHGDMQSHTHASTQVAPMQTPCDTRNHMCASRQQPSHRTVTHAASVRSWRTLSRAHPVTSFRHNLTHTHLAQIPVTPRRRCPRNQPQGFPAVVILQHLYEGQSLGNQVFPSVSLSTPAPPPPGYYWTDKDVYHPLSDPHTYTSQCLSSWPGDPQPGETERLREKWKERE